MPLKVLPTAAVIALMGVSTSLAAEAKTTVKDRDGQSLGTVSVSDTASGQAHVLISLTGLPEGVHGVHIHETGDCSADDFNSAGGHLSGGREHGVLVEGGPHPGDLPNATVQPDQTVQLEYFASLLSVDQMLDSDGAAFVVHAQQDDYQSQPSGEAGDRIACGVFEVER